MSDFVRVSGLKTGAKSPNSAVTCDGMSSIRFPISTNPGMIVTHNHLLKPLELGNGVGWNFRPLDDGVFAPKDSREYEVIADGSAYDFKITDAEANFCNHVCTQFWDKHGLNKYNKFCA